MTALAVQEVTEDNYVAPKFAPEHYGCPPWCTRNVRGAHPLYTGHDSADGMPGEPGFRGYRHTVGAWIPYAASDYPSWNPNPLSIHMSRGPGAAEPKISVCNPVDDWAEFTLGEASELADEIRRAVAAYGRPQCPPWCQDKDKHHNPADRDNHAACGGTDYASAPRNGRGYANPYAVDLVQGEPHILLMDGVHDRPGEETRLTLREAEAAAAAITELVAAAREGRPVSASAREAWS